MSGAVLHASFVRVPGQRDRIYVQRTDGTEASWVFPSYGTAPPHDLVHLVIESAFGLRNGFWGRVDAGADPARINEEANRAGGADKYRGFGDDRREILLAEALAGAPWTEPDVEAGALMDRIEDNLRRMEVPRPEGLVAERVAAARAAVQRLAARWRAFEGKGTIALAFHPDDPARGFAALAGA